MEAEITLFYDEEKEAKTIFNAVSPDNVDMPEGLLLNMRTLGNRVITLIKYEDKNIATFLSTIDDLLSCVSIAEKTCLAVKKQEKDAHI